VASIVCGKRLKAQESRQTEEQPLMDSTC
jgi:hypothetical protein